MAQKTVVKFPSPCGVSFILINGKGMFAHIDISKFSSPYGVSFILIYMENFTALQQEEFIKFPSPYRVSFILIY